MKKILAILLSLCMIITSTIIATAEEVPMEKEEMTALDVMVAAYRVLSSENAGEDIWSTIEGIKRYEPLYDSNGDVIAHYMSFNPEGYIIINNNVNNPIALEFNACGSYDDEMTSIKQQKKVVTYMAVDNEDNNEQQNEILKDRLETVNTLEKEIHSEIKNQLMTEKAVTKKSSDIFSAEKVSLATIRSSYGIFDSSDLPSGTYTTGNLPNFYSVGTWGTTGEFSGINGADDHCGATGAFNVVNYYRTRLSYNNLFVNGSDRDATFEAIHENIGNGPVTFSQITSGLSPYVRGTGKGLTYMPASYYSDIKEYIDAGKMCLVLLVSSSYDEAHYVNVIGYREYSGGVQYLRIVDNWNNNTNKYINSINIYSGYMMHIV
ncbi:MAG: hypothetical protein E7299_03435 [Lachnospiraceae bacterium]|nr:hypothetical protein [Lachnospiraceae bacterium]